MNSSNKQKFMNNRICTHSHVSTWYAWHFAIVCKNSIIFEKLSISYIYYNILCIVLLRVHTRMCIMFQTKEKYDAVHNLKLTSI